MIEKEFRPDNVSLWIVNYRRWRECSRTVEMWLDSFPFEEVNIIANHSEQRRSRFPKEIQKKIRIWPNSLRPDWMMGSLAECWNRAYVNTFPDRYWCLCSQDDVEVVPGWDELIRKHKKFELFMAPIGDTIHLASRDSLRRIGWWDERYRLLYYQEHDYLLRAIRAGTPMSVIDNHPWKLAVNPIGLEKHWRVSARTEEVLNTGCVHGNRMIGEAYKIWHAKWGFGPQELYLGRHYEIRKRLPEINWYPSYTLEHGPVGDE